MKKLKVLMLSDHPLTPSGVGNQARFLIDGLLKTGQYTFRCLGAAVKHSNYDVITVNEDFIIKPIDGFGDRNMLRELLVKEKPDVLFLFTDPRFFIWVWEMENEIHQFCPIAYWTVWDNTPVPAYNDVLYRSTDLLNCHSYLTYQMIGELQPERLTDGSLNFIPHALPQELFFELPINEKLKARQKLLPPEHTEDFICIWINRNANRKRAPMLVEGWKKFIDKLNKKHGHKKASLVLHTNPMDDMGSNLLKVTEFFGVQESVIFSTQHIDFIEMNKMHNMSDCCINISSQEGFGLATLEAMQCGNPIIALKTGGMIRQIVDHRDQTENGIALDVEHRELVGSQLVCYIYEDLCSSDSIADALLKMYDLGPEGRKKLGAKAKAYVNSEFLLKDTIKKWHDTLQATTTKWKTNKALIYKSWELIEV